MNNEEIRNSIKQNLFLIIAIALMAISLIIAFSFLLPESGHLWWKRTKSFALQPGIVSGVFAIVIYSAVIIRNDITVFKNPIKVILVILNITFVATFSKTFLSNEKWFMFGISSQTLAIMCVVFSWLGMKSIAGFSWIILFIVSIPTLTKINNEMGLFGYIYILSAFLSIGMQIAGGYITLNIDNLKADFFTTANTIKSDVNQSIETSKAVGNNTIESVKMATGITNSKKDII